MTDERTRIIDLTDEALHRSQFDQRIGGETRQSNIAFIEYCSARVLERVGRCSSSDCDEYRALLRFAGKAN